MLRCCCCIIFLFFVLDWLFLFGVRIDLWLNHLTVENNAPAYDPISIDNSGLNIGQQGGQVNMHNVVVDTERSGTDSGPALRINRAAANIDLISLQGNHTGIIWNGNNNGDYPSSLSRAQLSGTTCLLLTEHESLTGIDNTIRLNVVVQ